MDDDRLKAVEITLTGVGEQLKTIVKERKEDKAEAIAARDENQDAVISRLDKINGGLEDHGDRILKIETKDEERLAIAGRTGDFSVVTPGITPIKVAVGVGGVSAGGIVLYILKMLQEILAAQTGVG